MDYDKIDPAFKVLVEDVLLNRNDEATEKLIDFAEAIKAGTVTLGTGTPEERINAAMLEGMNVLRALFERATKLRRIQKSSKPFSNLAVAQCLGLRKKKRLS